MLLSLKNENPDFIQEKISDRFNLFRYNKLQTADNFREDVIRGLNSEKKFLLPKYFYDQKGSELFGRICETKEYYLTRTEQKILQSNAGIIFENSSGIHVIAELGSGNSYKTEILLGEFQNKPDELLYVPIDISEVLIESSVSLTAKFNKLFVSGIISYYEQGMKLLNDNCSDNKMILFLGSSIGNFTPEESELFITSLGKLMNDGDSLLIGFDMIKDRNILLDAYNDKSGVTSEFNLNILNRISRELSADFESDNFEHVAVYNEDQNRIEMYLKSKDNFKVTIPGNNKTIDFKKGEYIHTENSYKFSKESISKLAENSGFQIMQSYSDDEGYFSICTFKLKSNLHAAD